MMCTPLSVKTIWLNSPTFRAKEASAWMMEMEGGREGGREGLNNQSELESRADATEGSDKLIKMNIPHTAREGGKDRKGKHTLETIPLHFMRSSPAAASPYSPSKGFCIDPRPKKPRLPPALALLQSLSTCTHKRIIVLFESESEKCM